MASELFEDIFHSGTSGCVRTCHCGRTYFNWEDTTVDWEDGELEELQEKAEENPDMFIGVDYSVPTLSISIDGHEIVMGCKCDSADKYENFINQYDKQIARYLNKKAEDLKSKADDIKVGK